MASDSHSGLFDLLVVFLYKKYWRKCHRDPESGTANSVSMQSCIGFLEKKNQTNKN